ncbi:inositol monophosphatase [Tsukamurella sp. 8F]|uniref:inositol monophosphatase family protein n=1 Tax=unclassified Tsukamurella TaxID=2633480 RepID=UPI0023B8D219|nr:MULTISPECIES: inositol monophosphatase [unclassified Tsukamurella]MDF0529225.1 inositol monophosphatase [Tsukamurella sp. 8J]MDF0585410.1 inositol monophosphatase [Tsukamurella sp. 8F]
MNLPTGFSGDPDALIAAAATILDDVTPRFVEGLGAPATVDKGPADFATDLDLELERRITSALVDATGIEVHGEEFGGPDVGAGTVWVLDPIDGTFNYSVGYPACGILLGLLHDGLPVAGLAWFPLNGDRFAGHVGGAITNNGETLPQLHRKSLADTMIACGSFSRGSRGRFPGDYRFAVIGEVSRAVSRIRLFGSTGVDMAYTASGALGGAVCFGYHPWDNAAGVALTLGAGGVVTDLAGAPWHAGSDSALLGAPGVYEELLEVVRSVGDGDDYREGTKR